MLVILPLVMGAIAMVMITMLKNQQGIQGKVTDSAAAATASTYYVRDIQSASSVTTAANPASAPQQCSASGLSGSKTFLLGMQLQGVSTVVSYYTWTPAPAAPSELVRLYCPQGSSTPQSRVVLSDNVSTTNPPAPVVNCVSPTPTSIPTGVTCNPGSDWTFTYMVSTVTLNVTQGCSTPGVACAPYQYALTGEPVSGIPVPPIVQPNGVLTLLGVGTDISFTNFSSQDDVCVVGSALQGYDYNHGGPAISSGFLTSSNSVTTATTASCSPASQSTGPWDYVYNCLNDNTTGSMCPTSGGHDAVSGNGVDVKPYPVSTSQPVTDPRAVWASQNKPAPITSPSGSCTGGSTMSCTPGLYANGLNITSHRNVTFQPGHYQFGANGCGSSLCIGSSDTVNFGSGHYTFTDGLNVSGSGSALCGGGTATSACPSPPSGGVFFYVQDGTTNLGNVNFANNIELAPIPTTMTSDPYNGVLLWQDATDNAPVFLASAASSVNTYGGVIYVPDATISLYGFGDTISTGPIVAQSMLFNFCFNLRVTIQ